MIRQLWDYVVCPNCQQPHSVEPPTVEMGITVNCLRCGAGMVNTEWEEKIAKMKKFKGSRQ